MDIVDARSSTASCSPGLLARYLKRPSFADDACQINVYNFPQDHSIRIDLTKGINGGTSELTTITSFQVRLSLYRPRRNQQSTQRIEAWPRTHLMSVNT